MSSFTADWLTLREPYDALFATFRTIYKQNKRMYKGLNA